MNPGFQVGVDVRGRRCLVIGGGTEAADKSGRLVSSGARVAVVSPTLCPPLRQLLDEGLVEYCQRNFSETDLDGAFVVVNTVSDDSDLTARVYELACRRSCLINSFDQPAFSNFGMAALVAPGHLRVSVSTSNASPSLARRLRQDLEAIFANDEFVEYLDRLGQVRLHLKKAVENPQRRAELLKSLTSGFSLEGVLTLPDSWRDKVETALRQADRRSS